VNVFEQAAVIPHLLRPFWLLGLLALPLLWWLQRRHANRETPWRDAVDAHLLPSLLEAAPTATRRIAWLFGSAYALSVFALAGPSWRQQPVPLYAPAAPLVVVMDASSHMLAADLPPSRLLRARLKIEQLIATRKGGQLGLVAYAGDAFTVAPISDDANSLRDLLVALTPDTMPVDGQRADRAIRRAADLLSQSGYAHGQILLLSDGADALARAAARDASARGYSVEAMGIGTAKGAPLPSPDGTFAEDAGGAMQVARLDAGAMRALARDGNGRYATMAADTSDLASLGVLDSHGVDAVHRGDAESLRWRDDGPFLLLALLPLVALGFRRGWLAAMLLAIFVLPMQPASAADRDWWNALWQRADERADDALRSGDATTASALAQTSDQRAAAAYRGGDFASAVRDWAQRDNADANYNRGNALAKMQRYPQAIDAYLRALQQHPGMADAKANLEIVRQLQRQTRQQEKQQQGEQKDQQQQSQQSKQENTQGQEGQSRNREDMQHSQQQARQGASQENPNQLQSNQHGQQGKDQQRQVQAQQSALDRTKQAQADAAEQRALQQALSERKKDDANATGARVAKETTSQREQTEATEALLQRVSDDPGGLLRRKFALEFARRQREGEK
jgi:Ca-activated chloride channel family protein